MRQTPDAVATVCGERQLSYRELNEKSHELAGHLQAQGVGPEVLVGICMERSVEMLAGVLGIMKAGGSYVPLDPSYPRERLAHIIEDAQPRVILSQKSLKEELLEGISGVVCFEELERLKSREIFGQRERSAEDLVYVLYTSGSTGKPKGVEISHRALVNFLCSMKREPGLNSQDVLLAVTTLSFDIAGLELFLPLIVGGRVVIADSETARDGLKLRELLEKSGASVMQATPASWKMLLEAGWKGDTKLKILCGGEAWTQELAEELLKRGGSVWNMYGPTETTIWSAVSRVEAGKPVVVGGPIANTSFYILDEHRQPQPIGVPGELYIGGESVARGYHKRPELTAEKFVADPFRKGGRLYRTGDLARYVGEGRIEFLGRMDNQVKIRGFRIELGEIEVALRQNADVQEAVVVAREDRAGEKRLVAYVVSDKEGRKPQKEALRAELKTKLPDYMVPAAIVELEALPLTPNGKMDRRALPTPEFAPDSIRGPRTPQEEILCELFSDVLHVPRVGIDDNFFALGGHSLLVMQLVSRMRGTLGVELAVRTVFEAPTVAELAARLPGSEKARAPLVLQERPERIPLSYAQERLWFLHRLDPTSTEYNQCQSTRLIGELDLLALQKALHAIVERHETLRTRFADVEGEPYQVIATETNLAFEVTDLSSLTPERRDAVVTEALRLEAETPFDLSRGPLFRSRLLKLANQDQILLLTTHHAVTDGWSLGIFQTEFNRFYTAFRDGTEARLPALDVQYQDYAVWQRRTLQGETLDRLLGHWRARLTGLENLKLPIDRPRPERPNFAGAFLSTSLPNSVCRDLRQLSRSEGATMAMLVLSALKVLLARHAGSEDIAVGVPVAGRNNVNIESLIGLFVNTLVLRTSVEEIATFRKILGRVRKSALEAYAHEEAPFEKIVEILNPERSLNRNPLFEVFYNYLNISRPGFSLPEMTTEFIPGATIHAKFPLTLYVEERHEGLVLHFTYQTALFTEARVQHLLDQLEILLGQIARDPDRPISSYSLVTKGSHPLLPDPVASLPEPEFTPLPRQVLAIASHNPNKIALSHEGHEWTYRELTESAKAVAETLSADGLRSGDVVAVSGQRSFGLISGILGILLARGVLLMLDSALPAARRDFMLRTAAGKHWLQVGDCDAEWSEGFQSLPCTRVSINGDCEVAREAIPGHSSSVIPQDPAYIFFTSGTTGTPKGILGTHQGLSHFIQWEAETLGVGGRDRVAQLTGLSFDVVLRDIFLPLANGATLCLPDSACASNDNEVIPWMLREQITILHVVPSRANAWLDGWETSQRFSQLRWVLFAGEPLTATLVERWRDKVGVIDGIMNLYGPTETTLAKCAYRVPAEPIPGVQPIGKPLPHTQALVINRADQLCGIAEPGEIVIRTPFRTLGYINGTQEDRKGFTLNPFRDESRDLVYRTGDCGSYNNEGLLLISGRLDDQVKIRGNRVEPAEVAAILAEYSDTLECAVVARDDLYGEKCLIAYLVRDPKHATSSITAFRDFLRLKLPDYMIPAGFVMLDKLPLTPNGKLDRKALPAPDTAQLRSVEDYVAPRDPTERTLARLWENLLKLDNVGVHDDFFALGGHSLLATRLVSQIRREIGVEIPLRAIFENTTIERLALQIAERQAASTASEDVEELLKMLESIPEESAERQLVELENQSGAHPPHGNAT